MKVLYFKDTDTMLIEFRDSISMETRELDEDTLLDLDADGRICSMTIEHASSRADAPKFTYEQVPVQGIAPGTDGA